MLPGEPECGSVLSNIWVFSQISGRGGGGGGGCAHRHPHFNGHLTLHHKDESCSRKITETKYNCKFLDALTYVIAKYNFTVHTYFTLAVIFVFPVRLTPMRTSLSLSRTAHFGAANSIRAG